MEKVENIRLHASFDSRNDLFSTSQWEEIKKNILNTSGAKGKRILQCITDVSAFLSQITTYSEKKHRVALRSST